MRISSIAAIAALVLVAQPAAAQQPNTGDLRIVVVEGEDAVNIIQQKTAVAPIVEVRDRNNLPVSGATVTFSIGQGASFGGQSTLTVVTNAAGQATATGLTPSAAGAIQIQATATFQGQTAVATIAQSNVMTAAEVATTAGSASGGGSGGPSTAAAGGGGGGGLSGTTIGLIAGAAAGGTLVATQAGGSGSGSDSPGGTSTTPPGTAGTSPTTPTAPPTPTPNQPSSATYAGPMEGTMSGMSSIDGGAFSCSYGVRTTGNATLRTQTAANGSITGTLDMIGTQSAFSINCTGGYNMTVPDQPFLYNAAVTGSGNTIRATQEFSDSGNLEGFSYSTVATITFNGTISGSTVSGTLSWNSTTDVRGPGGTSRGTWSGSINLSLR